MFAVLFLSFYVSSIIISVVGLFPPFYLHFSLLLFDVVFVVCFLPSNLKCCQTLVASRTTLNFKALLGSSLLLVLHLNYLVFYFLSMLLIWMLLLLTIFTTNSIWYFYFTIELLWFVMVNWFFAERASNLLAYFSFVVFNALIGIMLLGCLALGFVEGFFLIFIGKFGLLPLLSLVFNYLSYVSLLFLVNYVLLKLCYFLIYLSAASYSHNHLSELLICLASLVALFVLSVSHNLVSFNLYSIVSSTFTYALLLILYMASYNSIFCMLYLFLYSYCSIVLYYVFLIVLPGPSFNLPDLNALAAFMYPLYSSIVIYMLIVAGVVPLFVFFLKVFYVCLASVSLALVFILSFVIFFMFSYSFLNLVLHSF